MTFEQKLTKQKRDLNTYWGKKSTGHGYAEEENQEKTGSHLGKNRIHLLHGPKHHYM